MSLDADIDAIMGFFDPIPVTFEGAPGEALEDVTDRSMLEGVTAARGEVRFVQIRTSLFPALEIGKLITVGGIEYRIVDRERIDDGRVTVLQLGTP